MIYEFQGFKPFIHTTAFVHPQATVIGNVQIGKDVYVGPHTTIRGDWGEIVIEDGCNVQESCTIHMFPGVKVWLMQNAHIGHGAIIHGSTIGKNCLVGMNAVIMDNVVLGDECIVGALSFLKANEVFENRSLIVGNPAKKIKEVSNEMMAWKTEGTTLYQQLPKHLYETMQSCEPYTEFTGNGNTQNKLPQDYKPWGS